MKFTTVHLSLAVRVLIALCTRTFFQPDEYFQSLEPAHHIVFGYGHLTWEWLNPTPIRSIIYPALNVPIYWILKGWGVSEWGIVGDWALIFIPKIMHGVFAAATDIWICKLTHKVIGRQYVSTAFFLSLTSFFHALSLSRSLSNSLETSLTTIAFTYYPWDVSSRLSPQLIFNRSRMWKLLIFAALACMIRPTNAVIWIYLFARLCWALRFHGRFVQAILKMTASVGAIASLSLFILDSLYYQKPTFTPLNFLFTNMSSVSLFYGSSPWHYYLTQGLPIICTTALPFTLLGIWFALSKQGTIPLRNMLGTILWTIMIYSLAGHKEWRFIHPILPLLHIFAAKSLVDLSIPTKGEKSKPKFSMKETSLHTMRSKLPPIHTRFLLLLLLTVPASVYIVLLYFSGPVSVLSYIRSLPYDANQNLTVGFLMPCHSTPGYAYFHREELAHGAVWALGCEPPLQNQDLSTYLDQTDVFFRSPKDYLRTYFPSEVNPSFPSSPYPSSIPGVPTELDGYPWVHEWPRYIALFGALLDEDGTKLLLIKKGYKEVWRAGRTWEGEGRRKGGVRIWKWSL